MAREHAQRRRPDRAGGAEHRDAAWTSSIHGDRREAHAGTMKRKYVTGSAKSMPSNRSSTPPCPGIRCELSFTPASRLSSDSTRSPICTADPDRRAEHERGAGAQPEARKRHEHPVRVRPAREHAEHRVRRSRPALVFPGLTDGISFARPKRAPHKKSRRVRDPREHEGIEAASALPARAVTT